MLALEPYAVKVARTVLRGECFREEVFLPDKKINYEMQSKIVFLNTLRHTKMDAYLVPNSVYSF